MSDTQNPLQALIAASQPQVQQQAPAPAVPTFAVNAGVDLQPVYVTSVFAIGGYQINPWYCASIAAAQRFAAYAKAKLNLDATISFDWPQGSWSSGSPFQQSGTVPYIDFTNPADGGVQHMRAGDILLEYSIFPNNVADATLQKWIGLA